MAKIELKEEEKPRIDPEFEEITEGEEESEKQKLRTKWAALEAMVGTDKRIALVAEDLVNHFERRLSAMDGNVFIDVDNEDNLVSLTIEHAKVMAHLPDISYQQIEKNEITA